MKDESAKEKGYHIVIGGFEHDRIIGPIMGKYPVKKLFVLKGDTSSVYPEANELTEDFVDKIKKMPVELETVDVDIYDFDDVFSTTLEVIDRCVEDDEETPVYLNVSSAPKLALIAMISAGFMARKKANVELFYVSPEDYLVPELLVKSRDMKEDPDGFKEVRNNLLESGTGKGVKEYIDIPIFPLKDVDDLDMDILSVLYDEEGAQSIEALKEGVNARREEENKVQRSNIQYRLNNMEEMGLVMKERKERRVEIELTKVGEMYLGGDKSD